MKKYVTLKKRKNRRRITLKKRFSKTMCKTKKVYRKHRRNTTKRVFFRTHKRSKKYRGGGGVQYPAVYGIDNKSVLYPISPNGITAGLPDPPIQSNGPNGNGPIGRDVNSGEGMSGKGMYLGSGGGSQGTFAPQPLVNLSRSLTGGVTEILNGFGGYTNSDNLNPMPYNQPIGHQDNVYLRTKYPNLEESYNKADKHVNNL